MADTVYEITVKEAFIAWNELFEPGKTYRVSERVFNSQVNGKAFKDLCATSGARTR